jgi:hypothetical protein
MFPIAVMRVVVPAGFRLYVTDERSEVSGTRDSAGLGG